MSSVNVSVFAKERNKLRFSSCLNGFIKIRIAIQNSWLHMIFSSNFFVKGSAFFCHPFAKNALGPKSGSSPSDLQGRRLHFNSKNLQLDYLEILHFDKVLILRNRSKNNSLKIKSSKNRPKLFAS